MDFVKDGMSIRAMIFTVRLRDGEGKGFARLGCFQMSGDFLIVYFAVIRVVVRS